MRILIVSNEEQWENLQIQKAGESKGHEVAVLSPEQVLASTHLPKSFDCVLFRVLKGKATMGRAIANSFFHAGIPVVDEKIAFESGGNKFHNFNAYKSAGLNVPKTLLMNKKALEEIENSFLGDEIVVKELGGKRGENVHRCKKEEARDLMARVERKVSYIAQEFIPIEKEIRVLVIGKAVGAFWKKSDDWKHNVSQGAEAVKEKLTGELAAIAEKATQAVKLEIAGVDLAFSDGKWIVLETNRSPQFKGFQKANPEINVAEKIIEYLEEKESPKYY